jgi:hypothetical protein
MPLLDRETVIRIHLDRLAEIVTKDAPTAADALYASVALRWLADDNPLGRVAREFSLPMNVLVPDLTDVPIEQSLLFVCGGYRLGNRYVQPYYLYRAAGEKSIFRRQYEDQLSRSPIKHTFREVRLGNFWTSPSMAITGNLLDRNCVIRFVANKCGGAHHHEDETRLNQVEKFIATMGESFHLPDDGISMVFSETIGTAWFLINSPDIHVLRLKLAGTPRAEILPFQSQLASDSTNT